MRIRRRIVWGLLLLAFLGVAGTVGGFYAAGYRAYVIHTGSMVPDLVQGDLIIDRPADHDYRPGDVITFRHGPTSDLVTHRVVDITPAGIHTKGDANRTADVWTIPRPYVEGVVRWVLPGAGFAAVFLKQPTGFASVAVIVIGLVLLWQLFFPAEKPRPTEGEPDGSEPGAGDLEPVGREPRERRPDAMEAGAPGSSVGAPRTQRELVRVIPDGGGRHRAGAATGSPADLPPCPPDDAGGDGDPGPPRPLVSAQVSAP